MTKTPVADFGEINNDGLRYFLGPFSYYRLTMQRIELQDGGLILYDESFFPKEQADRYCETLKTECRWEQKPGIFGHMQPRLIASYGDPGVSYKYSGVVNIALPWTATLLEIKSKIELLRVDGQCPSFNYCLLNRYRSGQDSMGWHADDEPEMGNLIGSVSLGGVRKFRIRHNLTRHTQDFNLAHGSLLIMAGTMQQHWQHEVPKTKRPVDERINLTYRQIINLSAVHPVNTVRAAQKNRH